MTYKHGTYCGSDPNLKGKQALLRENGDNVLAQFDGYEVGDYAFGWHKFSMSDFVLDESDGVAR